MKKLLFFFALTMSILFTAQAGYIIRGINSSTSPQNLKNYTLTLDNNGPISAASVYDPQGGGSGRNTIVIVSTIPLPTVNFISFPLFPTFVEDFNIEVRDFHYLSANNTYVLCGAREIGSTSRAFVAVIDGGLTTMRYNEYPEADIFYSIWAENSVFPLVSDYYVCGKSALRGVIASVDKGSLNFTHYYLTNPEWEYHKIIAKFNTQPSPLFVVSGRNPECTHIGFTTLNPNFTTINSYMWAQNTEPASHCVVCDYVSVNNSVILASSYRTNVTLNTMAVSGIISTSVRTYQFNFLSTVTTTYNIQDVGMPESSGILPHISVVGYIEDQSMLIHRAWHGYVAGLSTTSIMNTNSYLGFDNEKYEHYKLKWNQQGKEFTGGYYQNDSQMCALFGTPLTPAITCDHLNTSPIYATGSIPWFTFGLSSLTPSERALDIFTQSSTYLPVYIPCTPFKGNEPAPELTMPTHNESEITTFYDHITVKDIPENSSYQIYSMTGQLIQTGVATPDISTANLSKGIYILRLENGNAFKFVK